MNDGPGLYLPARAKVNLVLRIVGRRDDGYHLLETLFHGLDLHDDVWLSLLPPGPAVVDLHVTADEERLTVPSGPDNLVTRALQDLARAAAFRGGFRARLHKRIPHGGGLGGGSSDAAAALRLGNALLGAPLAAAQLFAVAKGLGADVPYFLRGGSQWGRGVGDELTPTEVAPLHFVLLVPPFACPTAAVYKNYAALWKCSPPQDSVRAVTGSNTRDSAVSTGFCNDLEQAAFGLWPALASLRHQVVEHGYPGVRMSGSGSTLFVACASAEAAWQCREDLQVLAAPGLHFEITRSCSVAVPEPPRVAATPFGAAATQRVSEPPSA